MINSVDYLKTAKLPKSIPTTMIYIRSPYMKMLSVKPNQHQIALTLIEIAYKNGLINHATYKNIINHI